MPTKKIALTHIAIKANGDGDEEKGGGLGEEDGGDKKTHSLLLSVLLLALLCTELDTRLKLPDVVKDYKPFV